MREVIFYRTDSERCPIEEFLDSLSGKQAQKVLWVLRLIQELDSVPSQYLKKLVNTDDIWEVIPFLCEAAPNFLISYFLAFLAFLAVNFLFLGLSLKMIRRIFIQNWYKSSIRQ
jgi:hypothetical protein